MAHRGESERCDEWGAATRYTQPTPRPARDTVTPTQRTHKTHSPRSCPPRRAGVTWFNNLLFFPPRVPFFPPRSLHNAHPHTPSPPPETHPPRTRFLERLAMTTAPPPTAATDPPSVPAIHTLLSTPRPRLLTYLHVTFHSNFTFLNSNVCLLHVPRLPRLFTITSSRQQGRGAAGAGGCPAARAGRARGVRRGAAARGARGARLRLRQRRGQGRELEMYA